MTTPELFNGKEWVPLAKAGRVRTYHNSAILLPDGSILVGGHSPINTGYGAKGDNSAEAVTGTNNLKDPSLEILKPPYLFRGPRPKITDAQRGIRWGERFSIGADASRLREEGRAVQAPERHPHHRRRPAVGRAGLLEVRKQAPRGRTAEREGGPAGLLLPVPHG